MGTRLQVLGGTSADAETQFAADQQMLDGCTPAALRTYRFAHREISTGRFQDRDAFESFGVPIARRVTGGGAIWHHDEWTFAVAGDAEVLGHTTEAVFGLVHGALIHALSTCGVHSEMVPEDGPAPHPRAQGVDWCFAKACRFDLVAPDGRKLVGGAQRRTGTDRKRVLLHGSLPWSSPPGQDFVAAVSDQRDPEEVRVVLDAAFEQALRQRLDPSH